MSSINEKVKHRLSWIVFIFFIVQIGQVVSNFNDVPPPPERPEQFHSREELRRYLQLVHEYYAIVGRPRFGRSFDYSKFYPESNLQSASSYPIRNDVPISYFDFRDRLKQ